MLYISPRNGPGLEAKHYGLGLGLCLVDAVASAPASEITYIVSGGALNFTHSSLDCVASWLHCSVKKHCFMFRL